jgi:spore coat protein U-like protein
MTVLRLATAVSAALMLALSLTPIVAAQGGNSCTVSTTSVSFGTYDVFNASAVNSTGTVTVRCGSAVRNLSVALSRGQSGTYVNRSLVKGAETLNYNLYRDAACTTVWGDGSAGTQMYLDPDPPNNIDVVLTIYGRIPALQDVSAGAYGDTITATINW